MAIDLLLADADEHRPTLSESLEEKAAFEGSKPDTPKKKNLRDRKGDHNDLRVQKWALVIPDTTDGTRLLEIMEPLRRLRQEDQGDVPVKTYRVKPGMSVAEAITWRETIYEDTSIGQSMWPYYLLILGDFAGVSIAFQEVMVVQCLVGRIAFSDDDGYAAYAEKVRRWQERPYLETAARTLLFTVRDGTAATRMGYLSLMQPTLRQLRQQATNGILNVKEIVEIESGDEPSAADLLEQLKRPEPAVLFSMSHGLGSPRGGFRSHAERRARQGAMSLGQGEAIYGADVRAGAFLPGGVWFYLACFGAGTPSKSVYHEWLRRLQEQGKYSGHLGAVRASLPAAGDQPFVAALPQAALANPDGPLAVIGHVDLAWTYAFQGAGPGAISKAWRFQEIFESLLARHRVGVAYGALINSGVQAAVDLSTKYGEDEERGAADADHGASARAVERANLWMLRHDLFGYMLLGDPAVRVPFSIEAPKVATASSQAAAGPKRSLGAALGFAAAASRGGDRLDPARMAEAVREVLREASPIADTAATYKVPVASLERWVKEYTRAGEEALKKLR